MLRIFTRYATVGVLNTAVHWVAFFGFVHLFDLSQTVSNFLAFSIAVTFSFFLNANYTFKQQATGSGYFIYVAFMGALSAAFGWAADVLDAEPVVTLVLFSAVSLVLGFLYSKLVVFKG